MSVLAILGVSGVTTVAQAIVGATTVVTLLGFELPQRVAGMRSGSVSLKSYVAGASQVACRCVPELLGVTACLIVALALRARGDVDEMLYTQEEVAVWEEIKTEWPILCGADTLLNFQTWLRLIALMFVAARSKVNESVPMAGMAAVLFLAAIVARTACTTQARDYRLEGPLSLGGDLPMACEVAMLPRLAWLAVKAFRETPVAATMWVGVTVWYASFHYLNMASNPQVDKLFTLAHALEFMASIAFLINTIITHCGSQARSRTASAGFMHLVMPVQAALGAYYFLVAFEPHQMLVGAGRPFCLLVWANLLQLGAYLAAAAFFLASRFDLSAEAPETEQQVARTDASVAVELPYPEVVDASMAETSGAINAVRETLML